MTLPDCNNENDDDANVTKKTEQKKMSWWDAQKNKPKGSFSLSILKKEIL